MVRSWSCLVNLFCVKSTYSEFRIKQKPQITSFHMYILIVLKFHESARPTMQVALSLGLMHCDTVNCVIILERALSMAWPLPQNTAKSDHNVVSTLKSDLLSWIVLVCCLMLQMKPNRVAVQPNSSHGDSSALHTYIHKSLLR